ncbi:hypothetical protein BDY21DRAFT_416410 [Lineolata rhizophorae]|uniref:Protein kinase domain-containing protein n=1 Tax=Lineolata rhizophorae TaxID=578093 RepID=A0A6A6NTM5_9PEZI|nr:hypothetical protein BDY21DRAFT_416410 [Lineolata rhizophorae]
MSEQDGLQALGITGEWIWGDNAGTIAFAQAFGKDRTIIFRLSLDRDEPEALPSQLVNCYHVRDVPGPQAPFPNRRSMRAALWSAVASVWPECSKAPDVGEPDANVDIFNYGIWKICRERLFNDYVDLLLPLNELSIPHPIETLGGRGCTSLVHRASDPVSKLVFKGIDFRTFLDTYESGYAQEEVMIFKRSTELVTNMLRHPNILPPPRTLVTISKSGASTPVPRRKFEESNAAGQRIPLLLKARWCHQMAAALAHTHFAACTYHMDIKPGNFVLDEDLNLVSIDWEQSDAPVTTAAPEIDGTWDAEEVQGRAADGKPSKSVRYTKYQGPERRNMPENRPGDNGWNVWNSFLVWEKKCPKASELAEVFSLGRSMWMLMRQCSRDDFEDIETTEDIVEDWTSSDDIPSHWKDAVKGCLKRDPNRRTGLRDILIFWEVTQNNLN